MPGPLLPTDRPHRLSGTRFPSPAAPDPSTGEGGLAPGDTISHRRQHILAPPYQAGCVRVPRSQCLFHLPPSPSQKRTSRPPKETTEVPPGTSRHPSPHCNAIHPQHKKNPPSTGEQREKKIQRTASFQKINPLKNPANSSLLAPTTPIHHHHTISKKKIMSLRETYHLACSAQARLTRELARPDRNLRRMVGHLAHYESLRTRIADMEEEQESSTTTTTAAATSRHISFTTSPSSSAAAASQSRSSPSSLRAPSPPPSPRPFPYDDDDEDEDEDDGDCYYDEDADFDCAELSLTRCPSRSVSPPPPELDSDDSDDSSDGESDDEPPPPPRYALAAPEPAPRACKGAPSMMPSAMPTTTAAVVQVA
nr:hypothetical protein CFP56_19298 [Quercus suber]